MGLICSHSLKICKMQFSAGTCQKGLQSITVFHSDLHVLVISLVPGIFKTKNVICWQKCLVRWPDRAPDFRDSRGLVHVVFSLCFLLCGFEKDLYGNMHFFPVFFLCFGIFANTMSAYINFVFIFSVFWRVLKCVVWDLCVCVCFLDVFICILFLNDVYVICFCSCASPPLFF